MPNTNPVNDSVEITRWMQSPERGAVVRLFPIAAATVGSQGEKVTNYAALKKAGAVAVSDDGRPILGDRIMRDCLKLGARLNLPVVQHAEDSQPHRRMLHERRPHVLPSRPARHDQRRRV